MRIIMKRGGMVTFVSAVLLVSLALFTSGDACDKVPSMSREDACLKVGSNANKGWHRACQDALRSAPDTAEVTAYALMASRKALAKYNGTTKRIDDMLGDWNVTIQLKSTLQTCNEQYGKARGLMVGVAERLSRCDLAPAPPVMEEETAESVLNACALDLWLGEWHYAPAELLLRILNDDCDLSGVAYGLRDLAAAGNMSSVAGSTVY
ncbi:hypothetical protein BS78_07G040300 [Paspalum vaginatum]|nr:hypothetical protein BS78_07G040300 [Paspalum vaginatum]